MRVRRSTIALLLLLPAIATADGRTDAAAAVGRATQAAGKLAGLSAQITSLNEQADALMSEIANLEEQRRRVIKDMRNGLYCTACGRTETELGAGATEHFRQNSEGGVGKPLQGAKLEEAIAKKNGEFFDRIRKLELEVAKIAARRDALVAEKQQATNAVASASAEWSSAIAREAQERAAAQQAQRTKEAMQRSRLALLEQQLSTADASYDEAKKAFERRWGDYPKTKVPSQDMSKFLADLQSLRDLLARGRDLSGQISEIERGLEASKRDREAADAGQEQRIQDERARLQDARAKAGLGALPSAGGFIGAAPLPFVTPTTPIFPIPATNPFAQLVTEAAKRNSLAPADAGRASQIEAQTRELGQEIFSHIQDQIVAGDDVDVPGAAKSVIEDRIVDNFDQAVRERIDDMSEGNRDLFRGYYDVFVSPNTNMLPWNAKENVESFFHEQVGKPLEKFQKSLGGEAQEEGADADADVEAEPAK